MRTYTSQEIKKQTGLKNKTLIWLHDNIFNNDHQSGKHRHYTDENIQWIKNHQIGIFDIKHELKLIPGCKTSYASPKGEIYTYKRGFFEKRSFEILFGYCICKINDCNRKISKRVHRIIAETFIPNINNYPVINHINGNKQDNRVENLEWTTESYNTKHAFDMGLAKNDSGDQDSQSFQIDVFFNDGKIVHYGSCSEAQRETGISKSTFLRLANTYPKKSRKYHFMVKYCL